MSPSGGAGGFYKRLVCWLKNRTTLQESGNDHEHDLCEKYMKGKYGLKEQPVRQIACKRLKLALAGAARGWPTPVQRQQQPQHPHSCCCKRDTHPHPQHPRYSDTSGAQSQSPRCSCSKGHIHRDSGISSLASSVAQTPSWECMGTSSTVDHTFVTSSSFSSVCSSKGRGCCHSKHSFSSSSSSSSSSAPYNRDVHPPTTIITTTTTSSSNNKPLPVRLGCCLASPPYNDPHFPIHATVPAGSCSTGVLREQGHDNVAHTVHLFCGQLHDGRFGRRCPSKTRTLSLESKSGPRDDLCATWPPVGRKVFTTNGEFKSCPVTSPFEVF